MRRITSCSPNADFLKEGAKSSTVSHLDVMMTVQRVLLQLLEVFTEFSTSNMAAVRMN